MLQEVAGNKYSKLATGGPQFLEDLAGLVNSGDLVYQGLYTPKKDTPPVRIYRGQGIMLALTEDGEFQTLLKSGKGLDLGMRPVEGPGGEEDPLVEPEVPPEFP